MTYYKLKTGMKEMTQKSELVRHLLLFAVCVLISVIVMNMIIVVSLFDILLQSMPKQDTKLRDCPTLAALKVIFDWLRSEPDLLSDPAFNSFS